jgi:hypothetical protein
VPATLDGHDDNRSPAAAHGGIGEHDGTSA